MECVKKIDSDNSNCLPPCSGLVITGFTKTDPSRNINDLIPIIEDYDSYKKTTTYPSGETGKCS